MLGFAPGVGGAPLAALDQACARRGPVVAALLPFGATAAWAPCELGPPGLLTSRPTPSRMYRRETSLLPLPPVLLASPSLPPPPGENKDVPNLRAGRGSGQRQASSCGGTPRTGLCPCPVVLLLTGVGSAFPDSSSCSHRHW